MAAPDIPSKSSPRPSSDSCLVNRMLRYVFRDRGVSPLPQVLRSRPFARPDRTRAEGLIPRQAGSWAVSGPLAGRPGVRGSSSNPNVMGWAPATDSDLQRDVLDELKWEPSVNAAHIGVSVKDGVVTLSGHVPSYAEKYAAERAAKRVHGVKAVANELDVKLPGSSQRTDEDIAVACRQRPQVTILGAGRQDQGHGQQGLGHARRRGRVAVPEERRRERRPLPDRRDRGEQPDHGQAARVARPSSRPRSRTRSSAAPSWTPAASPSRWTAAR